MAADSVEREILIAASAEVVWGVITEPQQISRWFSDDAARASRQKRSIATGSERVASGSILMATDRLSF